MAAGICALCPLPGPSGERTDSYECTCDVGAGGFIAGGGPPTCGHCRSERWGSMLRSMVHIIGGAVASARGVVCVCGACSAVWCLSCRVNGACDSCSAAWCCVVLRSAALPIHPSNLNASSSSYLCPTTTVNPLPSPRAICLAPPSQGPRHGFCPLRRWRHWSSCGRSCRHRCRRPPR